MIPMDASIELSKQRCALSSSASCIAWAISLMVVLSGPVAGHAECVLEWTPNSAIPGMSGQVLSMVEWDPDDAGPQPAQVIFGGSFTIASDAIATRVVSWDGSQMRALGVGLGNFSGHEVRDLAVYDNQVFGCGQFYSSGEVATWRIARWDGTAWLPVGIGVGHPAVNALELFDGKLVAGGDFFVAGGIPADSIAAWDGQSWSAFGAGVSGEVHDLAVFENELYAAGRLILLGSNGYEHIAKWSGSSWQTVAGGLNDKVVRLHVHNGQLIATGEFTSAGGMAANHVASYDGVQWNALADGLDILPRALATRNGLLLAAGRDESVPSAAQVYQWDGSDWQEVPTSMDANSSIRIMGTFGGEFYVGGQFLQIGGVPTSNLATMDGATWQRPFNGSRIDINAATRYQGRIVAGGGITMIDGAPFANIIEFDGNQWQQLGHGLDASVEALAVFQGDLIAGGEFTASGQTALSHVARWNGQQWSPVGAGLTNSVQELVVCGDQLFAFSAANSSSDAEIMRWDGASWATIPDLPNENSWFHSLGCFEDRLVISGNLFQGPGFSHEIAVLDGASWVQLGTDVFFGARGLTEHDGKLHAIFEVDEADMKVMRWDGATWDIVDGDHRIEYAERILSIGGRLLVPGYIRDHTNNTVDGMIVSGGDGWSFIEGAAAEIEAVFEDDGDWLVLGGLTTIGEHVAIGMSRLTAPCGRGDLDCDGSVSTGDVSTFVQTLINTYSATACELLHSDMNQDNQLDGSDVQLFISALLGR
ncbi:MAG: hypothetical protein MI923_21125 [Phycisphaerales bacterium]|nr:hypothetical protein [Phycisphaerales bacterium]